MSTVKINPVLLTVLSSILLEDCIVLTTIKVRKLFKWVFFSVSLLLKRTVECGVCSKQPKLYLNIRNKI